MTEGEGPSEKEGERGREARERGRGGGGRERSRDSEEGKTSLVGRVTRGQPQQPRFFSLSGTASELPTCDASLCACLICIESDPHSSY